MTDKTTNIYQRIAEVMTAVSYVQKDKPSGLKYSVVSHDAVTAKLRPAIVAAGIVYHPVNMVVTQSGNRTEIQLDLRFVNIANPTDFIDVPAIGYGIDAQDKGPGKAVSYAVKFALLKTFGLETGEDADLSADQDHTPEETPQKRSASDTDIVEAVKYLKAADSMDDLKKRWGNLDKPIQANQTVIKAKDATKEKIDAAPNSDLSGDAIPY